jgi:arabinosaccharide transport system substrate-binding protein
MYYNAEIMEEAGVDVDGIETWDDYIEAGKQVVENTDALMTTIESQDRFSLLGPMLQNGGGLYDSNNELIMDSPENVEAIEKIASMVHEHEIAEPPPGGFHHDPTYFQNLNSGQYASVWMPQWYMIRFKDQMPDTEGKLLVRPMPAFEEGGAVSTMGGGTGTAITTQTDEAKVDVAKDFLEFAKLTYDAQVDIWTELGFDPFRDDVYEDPALTEPDPWFSDEPVMADLPKMFDRLVPEYTGPRYPEAVQELNENVAFSVIEEGGSAQEALSAAAEKIRALDE